MRASTRYAKGDVRSMQATEAVQPSYVMLVELKGSREQVTGYELVNLLRLAIRGEEGVPDDFKSEEAEIENAETTTSDSSYLEFLREQIRLEPRGPDWSQVLSRRLRNLEPYVGHPLIDFNLITPSGRYHLKVNLETLKVVHWEDWSE